MKKATVVMTMLILVFLKPVFAAAVSDEKKILIDKLLEQTGQSAVDTGKNFSNAFFQQMKLILKQQNPDIDPKAFVIIKEEINTIIDEELVQKKRLSKMMYPIYSKHFSIKELAQMIELNKTPLGQKLIKVMPIITQEGIQAGQTFGQSLGPVIQKRIMDRFQEEGIQ